MRTFPGKHRARFGASIVRTGASVEISEVSGRQAQPANVTGKQLPNGCKPVEREKLAVPTLRTFRLSRQHASRTCTSSRLPPFSASLSRSSQALRVLQR